MLLNRPGIDLADELVGGVGGERVQGVEGPRVHVERHVVQRHRAVRHRRPQDGERQHPVRDCALEVGGGDSKPGRGLLALRDCQIRQRPHRRELRDRHDGGEVAVIPWVPPHVGELRVSGGLLSRLRLPFPLGGAISGLFRHGEVGDGRAGGAKVPEPGGEFRLVADGR